ncbi:oligosaccharide flippase family protein [Flavobacterium hungaricum]|uniref:Polysaccharide biosynthesis protein n=1 Tax=Flavobacterium hungaricum TaxID=2082725 RepID=A0ABR9TRS2_9FLAO|nr:oligosaccharide flippase family protein [Flavobacterium hungaricum]MBE8727759.1 hypothetical protein [Flavobacterium hungaricum]
MFKIKSIIVKNSIFSIFQIILSTLCYVVIYYQILHNLGKTELGVWSIITSLPIAISVFGSGVSGCVLRYTPIYSVKNDKESFSGIIFNGLIFNILFGGFLVICGYIFSYKILQLLFNVNTIDLRYVTLFRISLLTFFVNFITSVLLSAIDGLQLIFVRNKIIIFCSIVFCFAAVFLVRILGLKGILLAQFIQSVLLFLCAFVIIKKIDLFDFDFMNYNKSFIKLFLTYGQGFQAISLSILIFDPITKYFLNKYFNLSTVGIYDLVSRAVTQIRVLIVSAVQVITPSVSKSSEENNLDVGGMFAKINRGASLLSFLLFSSLICFSSVLVNYLDKTNGSQYLSILVLLCLSYHCNIIASGAYSILMGLGKLKNIIISHILSSFINIALFYLVGKFLVNEFVVLPISFAIIISSEFLIYKFKKEFNLKNSAINKSDFILKLFSSLSIVLSIMLVWLKFDLYAGILLLIIHCLVLGYLVFKNDFFGAIINKVLNK